MPQNVSKVQAQAYPTLVERGFAHKIVQLNATHFRWSSETPWVKAPNSTYVPYIIDKSTWSTEGYATVQVGLIGATFHKGKVVYYDPTLTRLAVERENWLVFKWNDVEGKWNPVCASLAKYFDSASIHEGEDYVNGTLTWTTGAGNLTIRYHFREVLKHMVWWTPTSSGKFALVQAWNGTQYDKVRLTNATVIRRTDDVIIGKADAMRVLFFSDVQPFGILEDQTAAEEMFHHVMFAGGTVTWQGIELTDAVGWVFYNSTLCTLSQGESLIVDPSTATLDDPVEDGYIRYQSGTGTYERYDTDTWIYVGSAQTGYDKRGYVEWNITSISDDSTITDTDFIYHGADWEIDCHIHEMLGAKPSTSSNSSVYNEAGNGTVYADPSGFPEIGANKEVDLGSSANTDVGNQLSLDWFAIGLQSDDELQLKRSLIYSEDYGSANPKPTLYVTYTPPNNAPTNEGATITNMDDTDHLYSMKRFYLFEANYNDSDATGSGLYHELDFLMIAFTDGSTWVNASFQVPEAVWSLISGANVADIEDGTNSTSGNQMTAVFHIRTEWDVNDALNIELYQWCNDTSNASPGWQEKQTNYADIESDLIVYNATSSTPKPVTDSDFTISGHVFYQGSTSVAPPSGQTVYEDQTVQSDDTDSNGAYSIGVKAPGEAGSVTYTIYLANYGVQNQTVTVSVESPQRGGGGGGVWVPTEPEVPEIPEAPPELVAPPEAVNFGVVAIIGIVALTMAYGEIRRRGRVVEAWASRRRRKPKRVRKWKKKRWGRRGKWED